MAEKDMNTTLTSATAQMDKLAKKAKEFDKSIDHAVSRIGGFGSSGGSSGGGGGSVMPNSLGGVSFGAPGSAAQAMGGVFPAAGKILGPVAGIMNSAAQGMPGVQPVLNYASGYYTASRASGGTSRKLMEAATFSAVSNGMTSAGADANMIAMLTSRGMTFNPSRNSTFMQTASMAAGLARMTNVPLEQQAASIEAMTSAGGASNLLRTYGIFTADPITGKEKSMTQIFGELKSRVQIKDMSVEGINDSLRRGSLSQAVQAMFPNDPVMQANFADYLRASATGDTAKYNDPKKMGADNPMGSTYDIFASETKQYGKAEDPYIQGMKEAVPVVSRLNDIFGDMAKNVGALNAKLQVITGSNSYKGMEGIVTNSMDLGANIISSIPIVGPIFDKVTGRGGDSIGTSGMTSMAIASSSMSRGTGGDKVGAASNTSRGNTGFISPVSGKVTARLGQKGPYWDKSVGHRGTDFEAPQGTSVRSIGDGTIVDVLNGGQLGIQVKVKHADGFVSHYCHLSSVLVKSGSVSKGQVIAKSGNTGTNSHGAHLHFVLYKGGSSVDPFNHIPGLSDGSGADAASLGSGASTDTGSTANTESTPGEVTSNYIGASGLMSSTNTGISVGTQNAASVLGLSSGSAVGSTPEALNGARLVGGSGAGSGTGYKTNAPSSKTGTGYVANDGPVNVHSGEAILSAQEADEWRRSKRGENKGSGTNVTIQVNVQQASEAEAVRLANMVKQILKNDRHIERMGVL